MAEYKADEGKVKEVCSILKAVLTSFGGELPMKQIDGEYKTVVGSSIPFRELKHGSLASFLQSVPDTLKLENRGGHLVVKVVNDASIDLILSQVQGQENKSNRKNKIIQKKCHAGFGARQLHGSTPGQQLHRSAWQTNTSLYPTPWQPTYPSNRTKFSYSYYDAKYSFGYPVQQRQPLMPQPPHFPAPNPTTATHKAAAPHQPSVTKASAKPNAVLRANSQDSPKTKKKVPEKAPAKKTYKQQLTDALRALEATQGKIHLDFQTMSIGKKMEWCTVITIGDMPVSSYPDLKTSQSEAEEAASKLALEKLPLLAKKNEASKRPTTDDFDVSINRLKQLMKERSPNKRFWWEPLRDMYCEVYKEKLPEDWLMKVKDRRNLGLEFENLCADKWTVALVDESKVASTPKAQNTPPQQQQQAECTPPQSPESNAKENGSSPPAEDKLQLLPLSPPPTPTWDVFVTCVEATNTVQLLLVGDEYSSMYSELLTEMELHYMEEKNRQLVKEPVVGGIYVASHEESWFRVEVLELMDNEVKVRFVDHGDVENVTLSNLFHLQKEFFSLPPQALRCILAGLEDAPQEAAFQALMETIPMGKTLVARVQRREEPYAIVLFDTSTNEDINLNEKVFESVAKHFVEPSLPPVGGLAEVYLTHVTSSGTLYVQVETKTFKILDDLLKIAKRRTEEMLGEKVQVDLTKLYLARFSKDGEWYRAAPRSFVDPDGKTLPCRLHNVPADPELRWTQQACERLMALATQDTPLLLKVVSEGTTSQTALVQLFKRLLPQNELVSINDTLGIDTKLFGSEGDSNNNSVEKEVVFRSQQPSSTSGVASQSLPLEAHQVGPDSFPSCSPLSLNDVPDVGSYFDVFVTYAANPNNFAVQPWKMGKKFGNLFDSMQNYYTSGANLKRVVAIESGQYCAVQHSDDFWYRAKVEVVMDTTVAGVFVDFGDRFFSTLEKVQPLTPDFCTMPSLAIKANLHGIEAANKDWSPEDACRFKELVGNKNLVSMIFSKEMSRDSLFLSLVLIDTSEKIVDTFINQVLVEENRATYVST